MVYKLDKHLQTSLIELKTPSSPVSGFVGFLDAFLLKNNKGSRLEKLFTTRSCQYEGFKLNIINLSSGESNVKQKAAVSFLGVKLYKPSIYTISNICQFFFKRFLQCTLTYALMWQMINQRLYFFYSAVTWPLIRNVRKSVTKEKHLSWKKACRFTT